MADLLRAAEQLLTTKGYEATTMSGIAHLAGASVGSLYQFFPSKESIGSALLLGYMDALHTQLDQWEASLPSSARAFGEELVAVVLEFVQRRPACSVLAEVPALVPESYGMERLSSSVQNVLSRFAPSMPAHSLTTIALAVSFMIRSAVQAKRLADVDKGASVCREMQAAVGHYLEARLAGGAALDATADQKQRR